eukprot:361771-Chlamydomonas_euryale.AAC.1
MTSIHTWRGHTIRRASCTGHGVRWHALLTNCSWPVDRRPATSPTVYRPARKTLDECNLCCMPVGTAGVCHGVCYDIFNGLEAPILLWR